VSFPLPANVVGDDPQLPVLGSAVAGEEPAIAAAGGILVGGLVVLAEVAPVASGMASDRASSRAVIW
jgi:hypothetical protein